MIKHLKSFLQLIRWPNLLMIMLAQLLLQYMLIGHILKLANMDLPLNHLHFFILMFSTVLMAAFGYAFNDVQDIGVDEINKDNKRVIGVSFKQSTGLRIAFVMLALALISALYLSFALKMFQLILIHVFIAFGLWYYSINLKKKTLSGNFIISLFTALSIYIVWLYHLVEFRNNPLLMVDARRVLPMLHILVLSYSIFAFFISMIRELVKDVEDMRGDQKFEMKTFAVSFGIPKTKILVGILSALMLIMVLVATYFTYLYNWHQLTFYMVIAVVFPLIYFLFSLRKSFNSEDFGDLSTLAKIIMIAGILSMQLFYISYGS